MGGAASCIDPMEDCYCGDRKGTPDVDSEPKPFISPEAKRIIKQPFVLITMLKRLRPFARNIKYDKALANAMSVDWKHVTAWPAYGIEETDMDKLYFRTRPMLFCLVVLAVIAQEMGDSMEKTIYADIWKVSPVFKKVTHAEMEPIKRWCTRNRFKGVWEQLRPLVDKSSY